MVNTPGINAPTNLESIEKESFESSLHRLEEIVAELERGDLPLESSLAKYEEGVNRLKKCYTILEVIEKKIAIISKKEDGLIQETPFNIDSKTPRNSSSTL